MISAAHMLGGSWACSLREFLKKNATWCVLMFLCILYKLLGPPQTSSFACYMRHYSGPFLGFLAYYMGAPSDQFLHLLWRPPYVFFFHTIWGPLGSVLCILYWGPQITFFAYYMGPLRLVSSHTIWGPSQISFIVYYMPPPPSNQFLCML